MFKEDTDCIKKLLMPVKRILTQENIIKKEPLAQRISRWNDVQENYNKYLDRECGDFLGDLDNCFRGEFTAALIILAISFTDNRESFAPAEKFSDNELEAYKKITQYNIFESRTPAGIRKKLELQNDETLACWYDDYQGMKNWVDTTLRNEGMDEQVRYYLSNKWSVYCSNIDKALNHQLIHRIMEYKKEKENATKTTLDEQKKKIEQKTIDLDKKDHEIKVEINKLKEEQDKISEKEKEFERIRQQWSNVKTSSSRLVRTGDVKQYEMTFIGRTDLKIGKTGDHIEIQGKTFIVEGSSEYKGSIPDKYIPQIKRQLADDEIKNLPENRYLIVKLLEKKFFGMKKRYTFQASFLSRPRNYAEFGFDTEPLSLQDLNPVLADARDAAKQTGETVFLCIGSPTGFCPELNEFINGVDFHKNFLSRYLSVCFLDLETAKLMFNPADEITKAFLPYCEMVLDREKLEKVRRVLSKNVDDQFQQKGHAEYPLAVKSCLDAGLREEGFIKAAFYEYSEEKRLPVRYIDGVGLVMMR
jgi:hypothetical protein